MTLSVKLVFISLFSFLKGSRRKLFMLLWCVLKMNFIWLIEITNHSRNHFFYCQQRAKAKIGNGDKSVQREHSKWILSGFTIMFTLGIFCFKRQKDWKCLYLMNHKQHGSIHWTWNMIKILYFPVTKYRWRYFVYSHGIASPTQEIFIYIFIHFGMFALTAFF